MGFTPKAIVENQKITNSAATYYTVPTGVTTIVTEIILCNTDTATRTVDIFSGTDTTIAVEETWFDDLALQTKETKVISLAKVMSAGQKINAVASSTNVVSIQISGMEYTA